MLNKEDNLIIITVADVMTSNPRSVEADVSVEEVIEIFSKTNFAGLPVVDKNGGLVGIVTQYDLVTKGSGIHIPTLVKAMEQVKMIHPEKMILEETLAPIKKLLVKDIMNNDPLSVVGDEPIEKAVESFAEHHKVNPLIVVDREKKVIGVLSRHDLIKILAMKELGRTVESAYGRQRAAGESEEVVGAAMRGIKKNFLFMPKYGAGKWIGLGIALFVIGLVASFLFIVKIPDRVAAPENVVQTSKGSAGLYLTSRSERVRVGDIFPVDIYVEFSEEPVEIEGIAASISFTEGQELVRPSGDPIEFIPGAQILNLKTQEVIIIWSPAVIGFIPELGRRYYLGTLEFRATKKGAASVGFEAASPGFESGSYVKDLFENDILDKKYDFNVIID